MSRMRSAVSGLLAAAVVKTAYGALGATHRAQAITCDDFQYHQESYTNPTRYLYGENCVDYDNPSYPYDTEQAYTYKNPTPQVIGSEARGRDKCNGVITTMFDTGLVYLYNSPHVYATGSGRYGENCSDHGYEFRTQHNFYQSDPYLSRIFYVTISNNF